MQILYQKEQTAAQRRVPLLITQTDGITPYASAASGQPQVSKNGATPGNTSATLTAIDAAKGIYYVELTVAELDTVGTIIVTFKDASSTVAWAVAIVQPPSFTAVVMGLAETGTLSSTQMTTDLTETTVDHYKNRLVIWTSGALKGQACDITAYSATGMLTYSAATDSPSNGDQFVIV